MRGDTRRHDLVLGTNGLLYGLTPYGGTNGNQGTAFEVATDGSFTNLYSFDGTNGAQPFARIDRRCGARLSMRRPTREAQTALRHGVTHDGVVQTLVSLDANTGYNMGGKNYGELTVGPDNNLYGTTRFWRPGRGRHGF